MNDTGVRLQKILSDAGVASRRQAEEMIREGEVTINGKVASLGDRALPGKDHIKVRGKLLKAAPPKVAVAFFKPRGVKVAPRSELAHELRGTIWEFLGDVRAKVSPIGRLDTDTEGLLLLTNDGELSSRLLKAKFEVPKSYAVKVDGHPDEKKLKRLRAGVPVEDKRVKALEVEPQRSTEGKGWIRVTLTDPRNRTIRKLFEAVGHPVDKVRRESFGPINLRGLDRGHWRYLAPQEMSELLTYVGLGEKPRPARAPRAKMS